MKNSYALDKIFLSAQNPRIAKFIQFDSVKGNEIREHHKNRDEKMMLKILAHEGNLNNLYSLFKSISEEYNDLLELPFIINSSNENEFIVVEGNRRVMVLKCLNSLLTFPTSSNEIDIAEIENEILAEDYDGQEIIITTKKIQENIDKINNIISNYKKENLEINANFIDQDSQEDKKISIAIFSNHVTGNKIGKRNWDRGKTLSMYVNFWDTISEKDENKKVLEISKLLNRTITNVKNNLRSASLIKYLLVKSGRDQETFFKKNRISTLEIQFIRKYINYNDSNRFNNNIKFKKNLNFKELIFEGKAKNKFTQNDLAEFIICALEQKFFNTRGISQKKLVEAEKHLYSFFGEVDIVKNDDYDKNFSGLASKSITDLKNNKNNFNIPIVRQTIEFIEINQNIANDIGVNFEVKYENKLNNIAPLKKTFRNLFVQYKKIITNSNIKNFGEFPFNAVMSTLRALIECLCYVIVHEESILNQFKKSESFKKIDIPNLKDPKYENIFLNPKVSMLHHTYAFVRNNLFYDGKEQWIIDSLQDLLNNKSITSIKDLEKILSKETFSTSSKIIHSSHLLFVNDFNNILYRDFVKNQNILKALFRLFKELKIIDVSDKLLN